MKKYTFVYYAWIPGYNDFDTDEITLSAKDLNAAWAEFGKKVKYVKSAELTHIDGKKVKTPK